MDATASGLNSENVLPLSLMRSYNKFLEVNNEETRPVAVQLPRTDPAAQQFRLRRSMLALAFYSLCGLIIGFLAWYGLYPSFPLAVYTASFLAVTAFFTLSFKFGWNLHFKDPNMTEAQTVCSELLCTYTLIYAGNFRDMFILAYVVGLMFAGLAVNMRQLVRLAILPVLLFPCAVLIAAILFPEQFDWRVELVYWISLSVIMLFTAMLVGHLMQLRTRLKTTNADLQVALERLTIMAERDELTGLYNRRHTLETLDSEKARADRGANGVFCVCLIDLDHFKNVNDTFGHAYGDIVLRTFARVAGATIRAADRLGRWGGEEFLLILPQTSTDYAQACLHRIQAELARTVYDGLPADWRITFSAGIAEYHAGMPVKELIELADRALYRAKEGGRNRVVTADRLEAKFVA
ncbi:MAG TPA: GGDEF domain-containing protein [Noviherbaspirillum sp.]